MDAPSNSNDPPMARPIGASTVDVTVCPHCQRSVSGGAFCEHCGRALPDPAAVPVIVAVGEVARSELGRQLQRELLEKEARLAAAALLAVAILQAAVGLLLLTMRERFPALTDAAFFAIFGLGAAFLALSVWARRSPLPAAIAGLSLFIAFHALDALADPRNLINGWLIKIIVIVVLVRAIRAGLLETRVRRSMAT